MLKIVFATNLFRRHRQKVDSKSNCSLREFFPRKGQLKDELQTDFNE
jgi:hypothetical protein